MKRTLVSCAAIILLVSMLFGCSAYKNPEKYVTIPAKGEVSISQAEIDKQLSERIDDLLESKREANYQELTDESATVQKGDKIELKYEGKPKNTELGLSDTDLENMKSDSYELVIGSGSFIGEYKSDDETKNNKGFEDQLIGLKKGEKSTVTVTFPDVYTSNEKLQGEVVNFDVEILKISRDLIDDKDTVEISYEFPLPEDMKEEEKTEEGEEGEGENTDGEDDKTGSPASVVEEFEAAFKKGDFEIDYTDKETLEEKFCEIFKISDYAEKFKGKALYAEIEDTVKVPEDVEDEDFKKFAGKEYTVKFTIDKVTSLPELTDEFIKENSEGTYNTVDEYKEAALKSIKAQLAFDAVAAAAVINEYPKKELEQVYKNSVDSQVQQKLNGSPSSFSQSELDAVLTPEVYKEIYAQASANAYASVKERLVVEALFKQFDITLTGKEYKEKLEDYYNQLSSDSYSAYMLAYYYGVNSLESFEDYYGKESLELQFKNEKLSEVIADYVSIGA